MSRKTLFLLVAAVAVAVGGVAAVASFRLHRPVARVNGEAISSRELAEQLDRRFGDVVLEHLVTERLVSQAARLYGVEVPPAEAEIWFAEVRDRPEARSALDSGTLTEDLLRRNLQSAVPLYLLALKDVPEEERKAFFREHRARLQELRLRHISLESEAMAADLRSRLQDPKEFATLAGIHSLDPRTRDRGGSLGLVSRAELEESFAADDVARLMHLPPGQVSAPMPASSGAWHLFLVEERRVDYEAQKRKVVAEMARDRVAPYLERLRQAAKVEVFRPSASPTPAGRSPGGG